MHAKKNIYFYSFREELLSASSHGLGMILSIVGLVFLLTNAIELNNVWGIVSFSIYGACLIFLYLASTLYHSIPFPTFKAYLRRVDHIGIYLLIAGSYTPFLFVGMERGAWSWSLFGIIWFLAVFGIILTCINLEKFSIFSYVLYLLMGWLSLLVVEQLFTQLPSISSILLLTGGITYTIGIIFFAWESLAFNHFIWHLFVLAGSIQHYYSILYFL